MASTLSAASTSGRWPNNFSCRSITSAVNVQSAGRSANSSKSVMNFSGVWHNSRACPNSTGFSRRPRLASSLCGSKMLNTRWAAGTVSPSSCARRATASSGPRAPLPGFPCGHPESGSPPCTSGDIRAPSGADARHWRPTATRLLVSDASLSSLGVPREQQQSSKRIRMHLFHATPVNSKHPPWLSARETLYAQFAGGARPAPG